MKKIINLNIPEKVKIFIEEKNFDVKIEIIEDGETILGTGGGTLNLTNFTDEKDVLVVNPDTIWNSTYLKSIIEMEKFYFNQKIKNEKF